MLKTIFAEVVKIYVEMTPFLFIGLTFAGLLHFFLNEQTISKHIGKNNFFSVLKASLFGIPLPLCSCGVIPTALFLHKQKASKSATLSFLISTPQTGIDSVFATYGLLGPIFAVFRPFAALITGIFGGIISNFVDTKSISNESICQLDAKKKKRSIIKSLRYAYFDFLDDIVLKLIVGMFIAGLISYFVPDNFFQRNINNEFLSMLFMILIGLPMYVCATGSIPIAASLIAKGISPGAAFVFLMVGPATNITTIVVIAKSLGKKITAIYLSVIVIFSLLFGFILNLIYRHLQINPLLQLEKMPMNNKLYLIFTAIFSILVLYSIYRKIKLRFFTKESKIMQKSGKTFKVGGMSCNHCVKTVSNAIQSVKGVISVKVILDRKIAIVEGNFDSLSIINAIENAGYKVLKN